MTSWQMSWTRCLFKDELWPDGQMRWTGWKLQTASKQKIGRNQQNEIDEIDKMRDGNEQMRWSKQKDDKVGIQIKTPSWKAFASPQATVT